MILVELQTLIIHAQREFVVVSFGKPSAIKQACIWIKKKKTIGYK